jgi:thiol-disulfide isomerase/thioredoxin
MTGTSPALLIALLATTLGQCANAFAPGLQPRTSLHTNIPSSIPRRDDGTILSAVAEPPFMPEEKEKKDKSNNDGKDEWTESNGGFIPNILRRNKKQTEKKPNVIPVMTIQEFKDTVVDEPEKIVVVKYYAAWCRSCRAVAPHFAKLASDYSSSVKFVEVPLTKENAYLHEGLGVPSVPFCHMYHPAVGLVEELKMNKKDFPVVKKALKTYVQGSCEIPEEGAILSEPLSIVTEVDNESEFE